MKFKNERGYIMTLLNVLLLIFFISIIGLIIGFVTKKKVVKIIFSVSLVVEIVSVIVLVVWVVTL